jgi:hypothetical protein
MFSLPHIVLVSEHAKAAGALHSTLRYAPSNCLTRAAFDIMSLRMFLGESLRVDCRGVLTIAGTDLQARRLVQCRPDGSLSPPW